MLRAVIFDMDGVLIDSEPLHYKSNYITLKKYFNIELDYEYYKQFIGSTINSMWKTIKDEFELVDYSAEELLQMNEEILQELVKTEGYGEIKGVAEFVKELKGQGYHLAVASSSKRDKIERNLNNLGIRDCFEVVVSGVELDRPKPYPDIFLKAAEELEIKPRESIVIEDSENGVRAAIGAGIPVVGFVNPSSGNQDLSQADYLFEEFSSIDERFLRMVHNHHFRESWKVMETERLVIREMIPEDVKSIYNIYQHPDITKYMENLYEDMDEEKKYMEDYYENVYKFFGYGMWLVSLKDGTIIGRAGIEHNDQEECILGYVIAKEYQRNGYAQEACEAILKYAREELGMKEVVCYMDWENKASIALANKLNVIIKYL